LPAKKPDYRRIKTAGISAFILFWVLISLGVWQLYRLKWKEGILAQIHTAEISAPIPLPSHPNRFEKVQVSGIWIPGKAALYGDEVHDTPTGPIGGGQLLVPLRQTNGQIMFVDLGWVHETTPVPPALPAGVQSVTGYIHKTEKPGWFAGADNQAIGLYYTLNPEKIAAAMGLADVSPYAIIAMGPMPPPGSPLPQPAQHLPQPPNNHYEYALTWFGFALVLVFEFYFFARKRLREP
jgi:surfeit locus 1 family protein